MTYTGIFEEIKLANIIKKLKARIKELEAIEKSHKEMNGKLHQEIEQLKKDNTLLKEGNEALGIQRS